VRALWDEIRIGGHVVLHPVMAPVWAGLVAAALVTVMALAAWRWPAPVTRTRRAVLAVLRAMVVATVAMLLLRPEVRWVGREPVTGEVAFLVDGSRSMAIRDCPSPAGLPSTLAESARGDSGGPPRHSPVGDTPTISRGDAVRYAFLMAGKPYGDLAAKCIINPYAFGTSTRPIGHFAPESADPRTDFAEALGAMMARVARGTPPFSDTPAPLLAVVVISDGRATRARGSAEEAVRLLAARGTEVHAVTVGSDKPTHRVVDVAVRDLRAPERVFVGNRPQVRAVVATLGMAKRPVTAVLKVNGREAARQTISPESDQTAQEAVYTPALDEPGAAQITVEVAPVEGELIATNNRVETTVRVEPGGIRVLYLEGRLHPEGKYIARALGEAKEIELDRRLIVGGVARPPSAGNAVHASAQPGAAVPQATSVARPPSAGNEVTAVGGCDTLTPGDLDAFNVVIVGDLPASVVPPATVARMAERVRGGNLGLLALGGLSAYGAGGWGETPLADVLPFAIAAGDGQVGGPIRFKPTAAGRQHFLFSVDGADGRQMDFDALPPLSGASGVGPVRPTARVLAASADGKVLLAVREHARGRVAGLTVDTTWQWVLAPGREAAGKYATEGADLHRRFWRQLILWLAGRDGRPQSDFWVATDRLRYSIVDLERPPAAEVTVHAPGAAAPRARLEGPLAGEVKVEPAGPGEWRGRAVLAKPGKYTVVAEAQIGGAAKRAETSVSVEEPDLEFAEILADHDNLRRLARAGGGTLREVAGLPDLLADLAARLPPQHRDVERRLPLAEGRIFLGIVIGLLAAEWVLRRRWGLA
jgi:uncharacterized membrane protein